MILVNVYKKIIGGLNLNNVQNDVQAPMVETFVLVYTRVYSLPKSTKKIEIYKSNLERERCHVIYYPLKSR